MSVPLIQLGFYVVIIMILFMYFEKAAENVTNKALNLKNTFKNQLSSMTSRTISGIPHRRLRFFKMSIFVLFSFSPRKSLHNQGSRQIFFFSQGTLVLLTLSLRCTA